MKAKEMMRARRWKKERNLKAAFESLELARAKSNPGLFSFVN